MQFFDGRLQISDRGDVSAEKMKRLNFSTKPPNWDIFSATSCIFEKYVLTRRKLLRQFKLNEVDGYHDATLFISRAAPALRNYFAAKKSISAVLLSMRMISAQTESRRRFVDCVLSS